MMTKGITFIIGCGFVVILRRGECIKLTRHQKDRGKKRLNLRANSLKYGDNDTDRGASATSLFASRPDKPQPESLVCKQVQRSFRWICYLRLMTFTKRIISRVLDL
jgi:hypothetical protein